MFDPTVFDNLKVVLENQVYDMDNLDQTITITNRIDRMEMSVLSREFALQFSLVDHSEVTAEIRLEATLKDLASEILELLGEKPACLLRLRFYMQVQNVKTECTQIEKIVNEIWEPELVPTQTLSYIYGQEPALYENTVELNFKRKISEEQMDDIPELLDCVLATLRDLNAIRG